MVDVQHQVQAVTRRYRTEDREGEASHVQTLTQTYPAPLEDVWEAVTSGERIARWFLPVTGDLRRGGHYQLEGNAGGTILECTPPDGDTAGYRVTWEFGGGVSWVSVRLQAEGDATQFELEHVARVAQMPEQMWDTYGPGATGVGWDGGLLGLGLHLGATEGSLSPAEAAAWAATDEGRAFYRASAQAWAAAHAESGADPELTARNAEATYSFYTGAGM
ncbi:MAG TPA: SRPBCC domain-containing protein [Citricoccus sp.]